MKKSVLVAPPFLKQKARQLKKEKSLKQRDALDLASMLFGFTNYQHYLNALEDSRKPRMATDEDMFKLWEDKQQIAMQRFAEVELLIQKMDLQIADHISSATKLSSVDELKKFFETKTNVKQFLELKLLQDLLEDEESNVDDYAQYHIAKSVTLKDLKFEIVDGILKVEGNYDLILKFAFDYDENNPHDVFKDDYMFGSFDLTIDAEKNIVVEDMDIGHNW
ncbi:hypothetical protein [Bdellovibrio bacteriovorus]|uniref:hypothetical protein n=1 Tax=Bdellovibrio bacteriovorus TaxID=959 RepID=UPI0035A5E7BE